MDRTERQKLGIQKWIDCGGQGALVYATGVGKTRTAIMLIQLMYKRNPNFQVLVAVPTDVLKQQWIRELIKWKLISNVKVEIFNTIIKNHYDVNLFVVDECHLSPSVANIHMYECVRYKYILGLTATWERLDGAEVALERYMKVCDTITLKEALKNGWVSPLRNYLVLLNVDLSIYNQLNQKFQSIFSFFGHDFKLVMSLVQNKNKAKVWCKKFNYEYSKVSGYLAAFMRLLRQRKTFVMSHKKKFEIAEKILNARSDKKCITFSATIKDAENFKPYGYVLHSKQKQALNKKIIDEFNTLNKGVLSSSKACDAGVDIKGLSVGIILSGDSSTTRAVQRIGRIVRAEDGKLAEMFTLVIANTVEQTWFANANRNQSYITINEEQLETVLNEGSVCTRPKKIVSDLENRF